MKICSLSSGSSGNCVFVATDYTKILIDAGISAKKIKEELDKIGESADSIDAVLFTHEHSDHIQSMGVLARKYGMSIYGTKGTLKAALQKSSTGPVNQALVNVVTPDSIFMIGDIMVTPFRVSHDAADPVAYTFTNGNHKIGMATDLGIYDDYIFNNLLNSDILYIESNHDIRMLEVGPYSYDLKQRIKSNIGHLSNDACAELVVKLCKANKVKITDVILGHLSEENNFPDLAYQTVYSEVVCQLSDSERPNIYVAPRSEHSHIAIV